MGQLTSNDSVSIPDNEVPININDDDGIKFINQNIRCLIIAFCRGTCEI